MVFLKLYALYLIFSACLLCVVCQIIVVYAISFWRRIHAHIGYWTACYSLVLWLDWLITWYGDLSNRNMCRLMHLVLANFRLVSTNFWFHVLWWLICIQVMTFVLLVVKITNEWLKASVGSSFKHLSLDGLHMDEFSYTTICNYMCYPSNDDCVEKNLYWQWA